MPAGTCSSLTRPLLPLAGKSALHWAAAVNNVEAAVVLLKNGANKDMQNNKVGRASKSRPLTPLFSDWGTPKPVTSAPGPQLPNL